MLTILLITKRAFRRGDNVEKGADEIETKDEAKTDTVIEDKIKNDVVVNSSLERTRRLLKSRINVESGQGEFFLQVLSLKLSNNFKSRQKIRSRRCIARATKADETAERGGGGGKGRDSDRVQE